MHVSFGTSSVPLQCFAKSPPAGYVSRYNKMNFVWFMEMCLLSITPPGIVLELGRAPLHVPSSLKGECTQKRLVFLLYTFGVEGQGSATD